MGHQQEEVLLRTSSLLTYEIAERLHFANPPAFNNFFKRETGLTPKEYRESRLSAAKVDKRPV